MGEFRVAIPGVTIRERLRVSDEVELFTVDVRRLRLGSIHAAGYGEELGA